MPTISKRKTMVKLGHCPSCGGWTFLEPGPGREMWQVCLNCGWQRPMEPADSPGRDRPGESGEPN
ncbi:MAG: hypothetical protein ACYC3V_11300 [Chloroflexota bacterium]